MRILLPLIILLALAGAVAIGTSSAPPPADFTFIIRGSIHTLDPVTMSYSQDMHVADALWEGLMRLDPKTVLPIPGMAAETPVLSADRRTYLFTLRDTARWGNGEPLTAHDFVRSWRRAIEPGSSDLYSEIISNYIDGMTEYVAWRTKTVGLLGLIQQLHHREVIKGSDIRKVLLADDDGVLRGKLKTPLPDPAPDEVDPYWQKAAAELAGADIDFDGLQDELLDRHIEQMDSEFSRIGLRAIDDHHLEVRLRLPTAYFLDLTAFSTYMPVHISIEKLRESYKGKRLTREGLWTYDPQWTKPDYHRNGYPGLITNGAYQLKQWQFRRRLRLEANPYYWDAANVRSKKIDALDIDYQNAAFMLYEQHHADFFMEMSMEYTPELVQQMNAGLRKDIHPIPGFGTYYLSLNCRPYLLDGRRNPIANVHVRRALTQSVDRASITKHIARLNNPVATTFVPPGQVPGYVSPKGLEYDPEAARKELAAAGFPGGAGLPVIELLYNTAANHEAKVQAVKRMWEQELGLNVQIVAKETKAFAEDKDQGRYMTSVGGWFGDYTDPTTFLDLYQSENGNNVGKFVDATFDALLAKAAHELDPSRRLAILSEAEGRLMTQVPNVPLFNYVTVYAWRPEVTGIYPNPRMQFPLQYMKVEKR